MLKMGLHLFGRKHNWIEWNVLMIVSFFFSCLNNDTECVRNWNIFLLRKLLHKPCHLAQDSLVLSLKISYDHTKIICVCLHSICNNCLSWSVSQSWLWTSKHKPNSIWLMKIDFNDIFGNRKNCLLHLCVFLFVCIYVCVWVCALCILWVVHLENCEFVCILDEILKVFFVAFVLFCCVLLSIH